MAHYIGNICKHPITRCWRRKILLDGAYVTWSGQSHTYKGREGGLTEPYQSKANHPPLTGLVFFLLQLSCLSLSGHTTKSAVYPDSAPPTHIAPTSRLSSGTAQGRLIAQLWCCCVICFNSHHHHLFQLYSQSQLSLK